MVVKVWAGTVLLSCCAVVVGCGTDTGATSRASEQPKLVDVETSEVSKQVRAQASDLFYQWYGTEEDRAAAELLVAYGLNGAEAQCMGQKGFEWDWRLAAQNAIPEDPLGPSIWTNAPMGRIFSDPYLASADQARAETAMNADDVPAEQADAMAACEEKSNDLTDEEIDEIRNPGAQLRLMAAWQDGLRAATAELGTYDDYARCMADADIQLLGDRPVTAENFQMELRKHEPTTADLPSVERPHGGDSWAQFLDLERQWLNADWACRGGNYEPAMALVPDFLISFEAENREEIASLGQYWASVRDEASSLR